MIFEEFDLNKHNSHKVAKLIFSVDSKTYSKVFKRNEKAISAIEKLLLAENDFNINKKYNIEKNIQLFVVKDENINKNILGILDAEKGKKSNFLYDIFFLFKNLAIGYAFRFSLIYFVDFLTLSNLNQDDYYISELAVDESQRKKGIGTKIIKKAIKKAKEENYTRVILDVDVSNEKAIKLYESLGFKIFNKKRAKFFNIWKGMYNMEYLV
ncbi:MAG: GNAT family N-acetyltransferase [Methanobacteriaceae archaeon]|jgi:ribosomal protein S18 acetylase RimI-like enzyme|nr:GNAT family N-acetyltransferase [Candidatus Methanorudis spinitermitis]